MKLRFLIIAALLAAMPVAAQNHPAANTFIVPAVGSGPGANGSQWRTELRLHVTGLQQMTVSFRLHQGERVLDGGSIRLQASKTLTLADVVAERFPGVTGTGALEFYAPDEKQSRRLAVTARVYNTLPNGDELSQDVPVLRPTDAAIEGDFIILNGPANAARTRFNLGVYAIEGTRVTWDLLRANGTAVASRIVTYQAKQHVQYNNGIEALFNAAHQDGDTVRAVIDSGKAFVYGSAVDRSGDPTYVPGVRTREQYDLIFTGIDIDEDGTVDIPDANNDGVLDRPLEVVTSLFPASVNVIAHTEFGVPLHTVFEVVSSNVDAEFVNFTNTLMIGAGGDMKGKTGEVRIRVRSESSIEIFVIPLKFL